MFETSRNQSQPGRQNEAQKADISFEYDGTDVSRDLLLKAIDFLISIEPDPYTVEPDEYKKIMEQNRASINNAEAAIRNFGAQIQPQTLDAMREVYYSIINLPQYRETMVAASVASASLNSLWDKIGPWRR